MKHPLIDDSEMEALRALCSPLMEEAMKVAVPRTNADPADGEEAAAAAQYINGVGLAIQALMQIVPLTQPGIMVALGAAAGGILAQCEDRHHCYELFKTQMANTLKDVGHSALAPAEGTA